MKHSDILLKFANYYLRRDYCHSPCYAVMVKFIFSDKVRLRRIDGVCFIKVFNCITNQDQEKSLRPLVFKLYHT